MIRICIEIFRDNLRKKLRKLMNTLSIENDKFQQFEKFTKPMLMEFFSNIFENDIFSENFLKTICQKYKLYVNREIEHFTRQAEFDDMLKSTSFKNLISNVKRIILFTEFHEPSLTIKIDILDDKNVELRCFKPNECVCIDGLVKENKNYLVILSPPLLKNGYPYQGLKPAVIMYDVKPEEIKGALGNYIHGQPKFLTENKGDTSSEDNQECHIDSDEEGKVLKQSLSNFELKTVNLENFIDNNNVLSIKVSENKKCLVKKKEKIVK
jgi:hypothetical protein